MRSITISQRIGQVEIAMTVRFAAGEVPPYERARVIRQVWAEFRRERGDAGADTHDSAAMAGRN